MAHRDGPVFGPIEFDLLSPGGATHIAWSPDGTRLASSTAGDRHVELWDTSNGDLIAKHQEQGIAGGPLAFTADGKYLISAALARGPTDKSRSVTIVDAHDGAIVRDLPGPRDGWFNDLWGIAVDPTGRHILIEFHVANNGVWYTSFVLYDAQNISPVWEIIPRKKEDWVEYTRIHFTPDGERIALVGRVALRSSDSTPSISWDQVADFRALSDGALLQRIKIPTDPLTSTMLDDIRLNPDGKCFAVALSNTNKDHLSIWDTAKGERLHTYATAFRSVDGFDWSSDGRFIVTTSDDRRIRLWDPYTNDLLTELDCHDFCLAITFSPDSLHLAYNLGNRIVIRKILAKSANQ